MLLHIHKDEASGARSCERKQVGRTRRQGYRVRAGVRGGNGQWQEVSGDASGSVGVVRGARSEGMARRQGNERR
jgi:hypothetical protein